MILDYELKQCIQAFADSSPLEEVCGLVVELPSGENVVIPCTNISLEPGESFAISKQQEIEAKKQGKILAVYHSHCSKDQPATLSFPDIEAAKDKKLPYILYHVQSGTWDLYDPANLNPFPLIERFATSTEVEFYLNWLWVWGRSDCYTIFKNYYKGVLDIDLPEIKRSPSPEEYKQEGWDRYQEGLAQNGFLKFDADDFMRDPSKFKLHDVILMNVNGKNPHHVGIVVKADSEAVWMIHHLTYPNLSERVVYGESWHPVTRSVWRRKEFC